MRESEPFGAQIKRVRVERRQLQKDVADLIGCSQSRISSWEKGLSRPSPEFWKRLAKYVGVNVDVVRDWAEQESGPRPGDWTPPRALPSRERSLAEISREASETRAALRVIEQSLESLEAEIAVRRLAEQRSVRPPGKARRPVR